eukprot:1140113-Pelagomonas_calceolata.AAC.1
MALSYAPVMITFIDVEADTRLGAIIDAIKDAPACMSKEAPALLPRNEKESCGTRRIPEDGSSWEPRVEVRRSGCTGRVVPFSKDQ